MPKQNQTQNKKSADSEGHLNRTQVLAYLTAHPNFFLAKDKKTQEMVKNLALPTSDEENIVSLTEYQNEILKKERESIEEQLRREHQTVAHNYQLMQKMHSGCLDILAAADLEALARALARTLNERIKIKHYSFILLKPVPKSSFYLKRSPTTMMREAMEILNQQSPTYGRDMSALLQEALGGTEAEAASSYLCLPLHAPRSPLGGLCFFSADADRFAGDKGTDLIEFFQAILSLSLQRCLNVRNKKAGK